MMQFDRVALGRQAKELGFVRDTFKKVCRLADVLKFFEGDDMLRKCTVFYSAIGAEHPMALWKCRDREQDGRTGSAPEKIR